MKFFHEAPLSIFNDTRNITDGDYCLANVYIENDEYKHKFLESIKMQREVILDNGVFETGTAMTGDEYADIIKELQPTWYIIPDALEDHKKTMDQLDVFISKYNNLPGKRIGVVQGKTYDDIVECYKHIQDKVDMIAISFDYSIYEEWFPDEQTKYHSWARGRAKLLEKLSKDKVINKKKPHHLLGVGIPQEGMYYSSNKNAQYKWLYSIDTSNPVMCGISDMVYGNFGVSTKPSTKLFTIINEDVVDKWSNIHYNILKFKSFWSF